MWLHLAFDEATLQSPFAGIVRCVDFLDVLNSSVWVQNPEKECGINGVQNTIRNNVKHAVNICRVTVAESTVMLIAQLHTLWFGEMQEVLNGGACQLPMLFAKYTDCCMRRPLVMFFFHVKFVPLINLNTHFFYENHVHCLREQYIANRAAERHMDKQPSKWLYVMNAGYK